MYKILIVDDEKSLLHATQHYFNLQGFNTFITSSSINGLKLIPIINPDLIILDIMMPHLDGYKFIEKLKAQNQVLSIPFIFVTAKGMTQDRIKGYQLGCSAYLSKPFDPEELTVIVNNILTRKNQLLKEIKEMTINLKNVRLYLNNKYLIYKEPTRTIHLTPREKVIMTYILRGLRNKEIANAVNTSVRNVERYVTRLLRKTNTKNRTNLVRYVYLTSSYFKANDGNRTRE
nr:TctD-like protein [Chroomonas debatzensis]